MDPELYNFIVFHDLKDKVIKNIDWKVDRYTEFTSIGQLFMWDNTPEGNDFWHNYHLLFQDEMETKFKFLK